jgi:hypothetical protein
MGLASSKHFMASQAADQIYLNSLAKKAYINGAAIKAVFDSGAEGSFVMSDVVEAFGLVTQDIEPVKVTLADGSFVTTRTRVRARLRVLTSDSLTKYQLTTVMAYVLPLPAASPPSSVQIYLGVDWMYANKAKLDFSTCPFTISYEPAPQEVWGEPPMTGLQVLTAATDALYAASTLPLLTERQCKRLLRKKHNALNAFTVLVCPGKNPDHDVTLAFNSVADLPLTSAADGMPPHGPGREATVPSPEIDSASPGITKTAVKPVLPSVCEGPVPVPAFQELLRSYEHLFAEPTEMPPDREIPGPIIPISDDAPPQFVRGKRLSPGELAEVTAQVKDLLAKGYIQPSSSPWGAPVLFVPKKDGGFRMAINYRKLNSFTEANRWPLPRIDELLEQVRDATVFSLLDLRSGYHQVKLAPSDIPKTAFITPLGLYEFRVLPFGLCNAPAVFCRLMSQVLAPYLNKFVVVYMDDILVYSKSPEEHLHHLELIFQLLEQHKLYAKGSKCNFNQAELKYLGFIVGHGTLKVDPEKIKAISDWPTPIYPKDLQSFLGLANYFCKFLQGYSSLAAPLTTLVAKYAPKTKRNKGLPFTPEQWLPEHTDAFEHIKWALSHAPVLTMPDPTLPYRIIADASNLGTGAVLEQNGHPVAYLSHKYNPTEAHYHTGEQELLALIIALKAWRHYVQGCPAGLTLVTDHHPLTYLNTQPHLSPKQVRWSQYLAQFMPFKWEYIEGRLNVADPLSRHPALSLAPVAVTH